MNLEDLRKIKQDLDNGILISKDTWRQLLASAFQDKESLHGIWALIGQATDADFYDREGNDLDVDFDRVRMLLP